MHVGVSKAFRPDEFLIVDHTNRNARQPSIGKLAVQPGTEKTFGAQHVGEPTRRDCPVCHEAKLKLVTYVYGDALKHDNGRVWPLDVGLDMAADRPGSWCYVVEVCTECQWNHLHEAFVARAG